MAANSNNSIKPKLILVAGGSGSGKSYFVSKLMDELTSEHAIIISQDNYYKNLDHLPLEERSTVNFDHPDAIDFNLLAEHIRSLKNGEIVNIPEYDFTRHTRKSQSITVYPKPFIIVDGILILGQKALLDLADLKIFVDTADDIRILRRIRRDVKERGRSLESIITQYLETVRPMHEKYVAPSKSKADLIINGEASIDDPIKVVLDKISL